MSCLLVEKVDKSLCKPVFLANHPIHTEEAIRFTSLLNTGLTEVVMDQYVKIPHAVSAIFFDPQGLRVEVGRTFDEHDPYIPEEAILAPPESQTDRFWRRSTPRLTYLVSQFFVALLTGELPRHANITVSKDKLVHRHTDEELEALDKFFFTGLAAAPASRYQGFPEISQAIEWLQYKLSLIPPSSPALTTSKDLPPMPKAFYEEAITSRITSAPKISNIRYEMQIWNPRYKNAAKVVVNAPSQVVIGRKVDPTTGQNVPETTPVEQNMVETDGVLCYTILVEGDQCLSRRHIELSFPENPLEKPSVKDLRSTHGVVVFRDRSRSFSSSVSILSGEKSAFLSPEDQHLKLGNTYVRIRLTVIAPSNG